MSGNRNEASKLQKTLALDLKDALVIYGARTDVEVVSGGSLIFWKDAGFYRTAF